MISLNCLNGIVCPGLQDLIWTVAFGCSSPFYRLFVSPHVTTFSFQCQSFRGRALDEILPNLTSMFVEPQTSSFQSLEVYLNIDTPMDLKSAVSSAVLRCGSSLTTPYATAPPSDVAIQHITKLPKLTTWFATDEPPRVSDSSPTDVFPKLTTLYLPENTSVGWIPSLGASARRASSGSGAHAPLDHGPGQQLTTLPFWVKVSVDVALLFHITLFRGLVLLILESFCSSRGGCAFCSTDDDIAEVATALPNLVNTAFRNVCAAKSWRTTVTSLLFLSTRCKNLEFLEVHFNTVNLRDNLQFALVDPRLHNSHPVSGRRPVSLSLSETPVRSTRLEDVGPVLAGLPKIFPSLSEINGSDAGRKKLSSRLKEVGATVRLSVLRPVSII
jgi:hypothetical protein